MGLGTGIARIILFIFTISFFILGIVLFAGGIWTLTGQSSLFKFLNLVTQEAGADAEKQLENLADQKGIVQTAGILMVATGSIIMIISFFGCFGAIRESKCLLVSFCISIGILLAAQIALVVLFIGYRSTIETEMKKGFKSLQNKYLISVNDFVIGKKQPQTAVSLLYNYVYLWADCCGAESPQDAALSESWLKSNRTWTNSTTQMAIPAVCCPMPEAAKAIAYSGNWKELRLSLIDKDCPVTKNGATTKVCIDEVIQYVNAFALLAIVACSIALSIQLFVILFTICLICSIKE